MYQGLSCIQILASCNVPKQVFGDIENYEQNNTMRRISQVSPIRGQGGYVSGDMEGIQDDGDGISVAMEGI